jgi:hypothetical protein
LADKGVVAVKRIRLADPRGQAHPTRTPLVLAVGKAPEIGTPTRWQGIVNPLLKGRSMEPDLTVWEGDFEELLGYEDKLLADPELCELLFASKHEALSAGFFIAGRATWSDNASRAGSDLSGARATATAAQSTRHSSESADRLPDGLIFDLYSNEPFERFKARVHKFLDNMSEREYDDFRYSSVPTPLDEM